MENPEIETENEAQCKVRKRGNSSSSSSSLIDSNYRLKRSIWKIKSSSNLQIDESQEKNLLISARKLAAVLPPMMKNSDLKQIHSPDFEKNMERIGRHGRRASVGSHKLLLTDNNNMEEFHTLHKSSLVQAHNSIRPAKNRLKDVRASLDTSEELVRVLSRRVCREEKQDSTTKSLFVALAHEMERARTQVEKILREERANRFEVDFALTKIEEDKVARKSREEERIHRAVLNVAKEVEVEKKLRRQTERLNKKLGRELENAKAELESEKRARDILEQVCDELASGIKEDREDFEELKKETVRVREEVEKEREMLQMADSLREERVQMKLSDAKFEFEEKHTAVEMLKNELEDYMKQNKTHDENIVRSPRYERIKELEEYLRKTLSRYPNKGKENEDEKGEDSGDSDLHSIELNVDNNTKNCEWKIPARKSISRKIFPLERTMSDGLEWDFTAKNEENQDDLNGFDLGKCFEFGSEIRDDDYEEEIERYKMIKDLRDHIVSNSGLAMFQQTV